MKIAPSRLSDGEKSVKKFETGHFAVSKSSFNYQFTAINSAAENQQQ